MTGSSAFMAIGHIFFCYTLFSSFPANKPFVHGYRVGETKTTSASSYTCSSGHAQGLKIVHRYGPCSPFSPMRSSATSTQVLLRDERRVKAVYSSIYNRRGEIYKRVKNPINGEAVGAGNYIITVGLGTPVRNFNLILDTGSFVTWVRCRVCFPGPCREKQEDAVYYPFSSSTFSRAPCFGQSCDYKQSYLDKSFSTGFFVLDKLTIDPSPVIPNFAFLCARNNSDDFGEASGILGLGPGTTSTSEPYGKYSLISQIATGFDKAFCHCLPRAENSTGYVYFGKEAHEKCQNSATYTTLQTRPSDPNLYFVNLIAITVGKTRLDMPSVSSSSSPSTIIDSGTVISRLPSSVYSKLRDEFKESMSNYTPASGDKILDTCYHLQGYNGNNAIPTMVLHFENLDVNLDQIAVTWRGENSAKVCLAFAGNENEDDFTIIGSQQLQKLNVLYNIQDRKLGIGPGNC